ncbi:dopamine receptor 1 [Octopus bimaculoides]|uniref:dopamine receptor 1 n=1 Tax=Octopus bimaculoides TaxID=37653 RepID=UPI00071C3788|nr:dopamine receptor 1 [Octopus bimaculoides]|eukprot:XP_014775295.1 PREDICTED: dopamine receptor 1-like [Octopus bimaculoides]
MLLNATVNISVFFDSDQNVEDYYYYSNFLDSNDTTENIILNTNNNINSNINNNNINSPEETNHSNTTKTIIIGLLLSIVILVSVVGNSLVCAAVFKVKQMRKIGNFYLVSLAIADLLVSLLVMTFALANDIMGEWVFGRPFCNVWISLDVMCSTASILNLCAISLDRYIHIRDPLHYENWMTKKRTAIIISIVWVCSFLISFLPIHLGWHSPEAASTQLTGCDLDINPIYAVISSTISFIIPCIVMLSIYCKLYSTAQQHVRNIRRTYACERYDGSLSDHKAAITLGIIMGVFLLCWTPFFVVNLTSAACKTCIPPLAFKILTWLGYANSSLNPIIYSIFNTDFREAFRRVILPNSYTSNDDGYTYAPNNKEVTVSTNSSSKTITQNGSRKDSKTRLISEQVTIL